MICIFFPSCVVVWLFLVVTKSWWWCNKISTQKPWHKRDQSLCTTRHILFIKIPIFVKKSISRKMSREWSKSIIFTKKFIFTEFFIVGYFRGKIKLTIFFSYRHNSALEDVRSRHHHRRVHQPTTPRENTTTSTEKTSKLNELLDFSTDSTPVSSDVEHSQNPSPRRACQRKRKERRDSIGDGQDKKFSRSSR